MVKLTSGDFVNVVQALGDDANGSRMFEGFLADFRKRPQSEIDQYKEAYQLMWLQIEAVETTLLSFLARCWDKENKDFRSIPEVVRLIQDDPDGVFEAVSKERKTFTDKLAKATNQVELPEWSRKRHDEKTADILSNYSLINEAEGPKGTPMILDAIKIIRDEKIAHSLKSSGQRTKFIKADKDDDFVITIDKMLDHSRRTGKLIDQLCQLCFVSFNSSPTAYFNTYGPLYWARFYEN
jgi:hypothetical protein